MIVNPNPQDTRRHFGVACSAFLICLIFLSPALSSILEFNRDAIASGEVWRLFTGHTTHWTASHLAWDLIAFVLLLNAALTYSVKTTLSLLATSAILITLSVFVLKPGLATYRGLSGLDTTLFTYCLIQIGNEMKARRHRYGLAAVYLVAIGLIAKVIVELLTHQPLFVSELGQDIVIVPLAHLVGIVAGCIPSLTQRLTTRLAGTHADSLS